ncbi:MAG: sulfurtransferase [candidate division NC10 bacterium]|nr:sulfurtransferase [candidate division NC10 bacterium]
MPLSIAPSTLRHLLHEGSTLALIDVREQGEYNAAHIPGASSLPRRLIEFRLQRLVPCPAVQIVCCDDDERRARLAGKTADRMGYVRVAVLEGGVNRWASLGLPTEWGMNVPSKDFGERVEVQHHVPCIDAAELDKRMRQGEPLIILDSRTPEEYERACIPGARNTPGGELAYRIGDIAKAHSDATVVVNCAGRTRSIIGTRILQRMGLKNVVGLKNGTSGWVLAGLPLEKGARRPALPDPSPENLAAVRAFAGRIAAEDGVRSLPINSLRDLLAKAGHECVYLVDVRTEEEYLAGHLPGFWWFPGGQAVQRADDLVAVRNATVVFCCDNGIRSTITASWYRQMGLPNVFVVEGGATAWADAGLSLEAGPDPQEPFGLRSAAAAARQVAPREVHLSLTGTGPTVLFVDTSREFASGHVPGARWISRSWLELQIESLVPERRAFLLVTDRDGRSAPLAAATLREMGYSNVSVLAGGMAGWHQAGLLVEQGLSGVLTPPEDIVPAGPERPYHDMVSYLRWEETLGHKYRLALP